jgi:DnaJ like chaperone protein
MSANEVIVVIVFGLLGYWIVGALMGWKHNEKANSTPTDKDDEPSYQDFKEETVNTKDIDSCWFEILEVPKVSSIEEITTAYKRKISQYHPDKVASLGAEFKELAETKSKEINAAYAYAKRITRY